MAREEWNLRPIFYPSTITVIGVSASNRLNPGTVIFRKNLGIKGFGSGRVHGVNPGGGKVEGIDLFKSVRDVPTSIDLAVIATRASHAPAAIAESIEAGAKGIVVISGGFSETGSAGQKLQEKIASLSREHRVPLIGPNCVGVYTPGQVNTFFIPSERFVVPRPDGNIAVVSQSGGVMADQFFNKYFDRNIGISKAVSLGNKAVLDEVDMLDYFSRDKQTEIIGFYLEGFARDRGREFLLRSRNTNKTILFLKGGKTQQGSKAASSHTASIATDEKLLEGVLKQFSIIHCNSELELLTYSKTFSLLSGEGKPFFSSTGNRVAIVTISGGHGVLSTDLAQAYGLELASLDDDEKEALRQSLSPSIREIASLENPIDLTGSAQDDDLVACIEWLMGFKKCDIILLLILPYPPGITMSLGSRVASVVRTHKKPVITYLPRLARYGMIVESLDEARIPTGNSIEEVLLMAHAVHLKSQAMSREKANKMVDASFSPVDYDGLPRSTRRKKGHHAGKKGNTL